MISLVTDKGNFVILGLHMARGRVTPRISPSALCMSTPDEPKIYKADEINLSLGLEADVAMRKGGTRMMVLT